MVWWGNRLILTGSGSLVVAELVSQTSEGIPEQMPRRVGREQRRFRKFQFFSGAKSMDMSGTHTDS